MITGTKRTQALLASALIALPLAACSSGGGSSKKKKPDKTPPVVTANPGSQTWDMGTLDVTLSATDNKDPDPEIYYTTDATIPTDMSTLYAGVPINLADTTILRFIGVDAKGNTSASGLEGYVYAPTVIDQEWAASGHGDIVGEPFRHWDADGEVSVSCARCHTGPGFMDYLQDGVTDLPAPLPLGHHCDTCHDAGPPTTLWDDLAGYPELESVIFPSGDTASLWGPSNMCISCHSGRESGLSVEDAIAAGPGPYTFINIHYYAAAASYFGAETEGACEYPGMEYAGRNVFGSHELDPATGIDKKSCVGCHMRVGEDGANSKDHHFLPELADCTVCHAGASFETLSGSPATHYDAITTLGAELMTAIQAYASGTIGVAIAYDPHAYPYFFKDNNNNGVADANEANFGNRYDQFDATLLRAAYNYQVVQKDPAGYIHNGTYLWQVLDDSITDLGGVPTVPAPGRAGFVTGNAGKSQQWHLSGHADSTGEPFRHWDGDPDVPTSCAKCHSTPGFVDYVAEGTVDAAAPLGSLVECYACHADHDLFANQDTRYDDLLTNAALEPVDFPSGATATFNNSSNICMTCHQGRESGVSVTAPTPNGVAQTPDYDSYDFVNRHYYAAAAVLFGSDVTAAYEYVGQTYRGANTFPSHPGTKKDCVDCHMRGVQDHTYEPQLSDCTACHAGIADFDELGLPGGVDVDYDGDGIGESFHEELVGMAELLYAEIQDYAKNRLNGGVNSAPIVYGPGAYPYWFHDTNDNGVLDLGEDVFANRYQDFDLDLLRAAYNYHAGQDPTSDIHNYKYVLQSLYDSADWIDNGAFDGSFAGGIATRP